MAPRNREVGREFRRRMSQETAVLFKADTTISFAFFRDTSICGYSFDHAGRVQIMVWYGRFENRGVPTEAVTTTR